MRDPTLVAWSGDYFVKLTMRDFAIEDPDFALDHLEGFAAVVLDRLR